jgi:hypothetical protein
MIAVFCVVEISLSQTSVRNPRTLLQNKLVGSVLSRKIINTRQKSVIFVRISFPIL